MEKRFISMLVKYFPDQAGEVVKYIRKAGYGDGEVLDLIDRTAGYNSNTAYPVSYTHLHIGQVATCASFVLAIKFVACLTAASFLKIPGRMGIMASTALTNVCLLYTSRCV